MNVRGPQVGIIMGSDSDLRVMEAARTVLDDFSVASEVTVVSAHRTPERMFQWASEAEGRGLRVIIAGAGGAAHLPGMVASLTFLPVIGVPVAATSLQGEDALLSIAQMPKGVPVATMAIDNAANAALFALRILAHDNPDIRARLQAFRDDAQASSLEAASRVEQKFPVR